MKSSAGKKGASGSSSARGQHDAPEKLQPDLFKHDDSAPGRGPDGEDQSLRISREDAQKNIPPVPDPDDPVSP